MKDDKVNDFEVFNLGNGFLVSKTEQCSDFIEKLLEKGILWEFLSTLINSYVSKSDVKYLLDQIYSIEEMNRKHEIEMEKVRNEFNKNTKLILEQFQSLQLNLSTGTTLTSSNQIVPKKVENEIAPTQVRVKKSTGTPKSKGGFAARAAKLNSLQRKD